MPQLVQGHIRFTEDDFLQTDYHEKTRKLYQNKSSANLAEMLKHESEQLIFDEICRTKKVFNNEKNIKRGLAHSLSLISAMAEREGYTLTELMRM